MAILVSVAVYFGFRYVGQQVEIYTGTAPLQLPKVEMPAEQRQTLKDRVEAFRKAVDTGTPTEPLVLTSDDLNALIEEDDELKGKIHAKIKGDEVKGLVSIPLDALGQVPFLSMFRGRYLNGEADLKASLEDGVLIVTLASFEVNGKKAPEEFMTQVFASKTWPRTSTRIRSRLRDSASWNAWKSKMARSSSAFELSPPKSQIPRLPKARFRLRWWLPPRKKSRQPRRLNLRKTTDQRPSSNPLLPGQQRPRLDRQGMSFAYLSPNLTNYLRNTLCNQFSDRFLSAPSCSAVLGLITLAAGAHARTEPPQKVASVEGITEYRLDNGLRVLLFPDQTRPKVTVNLTVLVGSRHEGYGETGMAHLLEHMVFKGTPTHRDIPGAMKERGAQFNGSTDVDRTNYFETLPATDQNLEFAIRLEADRMVNSPIRAEDLATEFSVVRNEFESGENSPIRVLSQRMAAVAYEWHNYGKSTIGNRSDIERVPVDNLRAFYTKYYQPDNAMLVVAGKFDEKKALEYITKYFGALPRPGRKLPGHLHGRAGAGR